MGQTAVNPPKVAIVKRVAKNIAARPQHRDGYLNESFPRRKSLLNFETLTDLDEFDYRFQKQARNKEDASYLRKPYRGSLYMNWARLYVGGRFAYATLSMAAGYIYAEIADAGHELLGNLIPFRYVPGKHHGKRQGAGWRWDMRVDAGGQEGIFEELRRQIWRYEQERYDALLTSWESANRAGA